MFFEAVIEGQRQSTDSGVHVHGKIWALDVIDKRMTLPSRNSLQKRVQIDNADDC
jgi:hypothetical protein